MKKNEIIILIIATIVIGISAFFMIRLLNPTPKTTTETTEADQIKSIPTTIDENTFERINNLSDYGEPNLDNIGKTDIFSGY